MAVDTNTAGRRERVGKIVFWAVVLAIAPALVKAQQHTSQPLTCEARQSGGPTRLVALKDKATGACTGFEILDERGRVVVMHRSAVFGGGVFLASKNGRSVIYLNVRPRAQLRHDGTFVSTLGTPQKRPRQVEVLVLFVDGRIVVRKTLGQLVMRPFLSHIVDGYIEWISSDSTVLGNVLGRRLTLETLSHRRYVFDVVNGQTVAATDTDDWSNCESLVYGNMRAISEGVYGIKPLWAIRGAPTLPARVELADNLTFSNGYHTACLMKPTSKSSAPRWRAVKLLPATNALEMRPPTVP